MKKYTYPLAAALGIGLLLGPQFPILATTVPVAEPTAPQTIAESRQGTLSNFPTRQVSLIQPAPTPRLQEPLQYINQRTREVLRYPYYETTTEVVPNVSLSKSGLQELAQTNHSDLVVAPVLTHWTYRTYHRGYTPSSLFFDGDDETYAYVEAAITIFSYNQATGEYRTDTATYYKDDDYLSVPSPSEVLHLLMDEALRKLPYKRIPTDINRYIDRHTIPLPTDPTLKIMNTRVDSPYGLPSAIQQF